MKLNEHWLREWVNPPDDVEALAQRLNMAGHECEVEPLVAMPPRGVVVGRILDLRHHPDAEHLSLCRVDVGRAAPVDIVCGAANAASRMTVAVALPGAQLAGGVSIAPREIRGCRSEGMLCSAVELGLADHADGILELDVDAPLGRDVSDYLRLDDHILNLELTPNRGDCLSVAGLARETAATYGVQQTPVHVHSAVVVESTRRGVAVAEPAACPHYVGRSIRKVDPAARTPDWMRERLRRSGIRSLNPLVDITNYVMIELGQPMHAFDNDRLRGTMRVRFAQAGEPLELLDGQKLELTVADLVIADDGGPVALAGIMGGQRSSVGEATHNVFLESACFEPAVVAKAGRRHKLLTDARHRFERGVDPGLQVRALERATELVLKICGGEADSIVEVGRAPVHGPRISLRRSYVTRVLGCDIPAQEVRTLLTRLAIDLRAEEADTWQATVPTYRYDLAQEADLVEEVGRLHGYDRIAAQAGPVFLAPRVHAETERPLDVARATLVARGYHEIVSYSFVDGELLARFTPQQSPVLLDNPISATMGAMRTTLWCGLVTAWNYNRQRQVTAARLFEAGACFQRVGDEVKETQHVAGLIAGAAAPRQWALHERAPDLFDIKSDVEALLGTDAGSFRYVATPNPALHDGCSAQILRDGVACGWVGQLHPELCARLQLPDAPVVFDLDWAALGALRLPRYVPLSDQPLVRRDLALEIAAEVPAQALRDVAMGASVEMLRAVDVFDVYAGEKLRAGAKSVALSLVFQDNSKTLEDSAVDAAVARVAVALQGALGAVVRGGEGSHNGADKS
ncbi:MAG TPA: phenylalanine--tRNA ligase subunit beta [Nevskiaceae bacterium]|nr:phenylalanine--tRNA ligase subunit beta [Nevskiaceae bacterium]